MRRLMVLLGLLIAVPAMADNITTTRQTLPDGSRMLQQSVKVDAAITDVWYVFTTAEGWMSWAVPFAEVDFRLGGLIETSYQADAVAGDPANIKNRILSYLPYRMLSIQAVQAPPGFEHAEFLSALHTVIELEAINESQTQVTISGVGYRQGDGFDALLEKFEQGNAWTLKQLRARFEAPANLADDRG